MPPDYGGICMGVDLKNKDLPLGCLQGGDESHQPSQRKSSTSAVGPTRDLFQGEIDLDQSIRGFISHNVFIKWF